MLDRNPQAGQCCIVRMQIMRKYALHALALVGTQDAPFADVSLVPVEPEALLYGDIVPNLYSN